MAKPTALIQISNVNHTSFDYSIVINNFDSGKNYYAQIYDTTSSTIQSVNVVSYTTFSTTATNLSVNHTYVVSINGDYTDVFGPVYGAMISYDFATTPAYTYSTLQTDSPAPIIGISIGIGFGGLIIGIVLSVLFFKHRKKKKKRYDIKTNQVNIDTAITTVQPNNKIIN